jgi:ribonuclease-3
MEDRNLLNDLEQLQKILRVTFNDNKVLLTAITHRSYLNEHREATWDHNERLEFLGDAVLELVVTDFLFAEYPDKPEGELTAIRAALVNTVSLSAAAETLGVNQFLLMSKGEAKDVGRARQYILANVFEACIGAIYIDQGYDASKTFIADRLFPKTEEIVRKRLWQDAKSQDQITIGYLPLEFFFVAKKLPKVSAPQNKKPNSKRPKKLSKQKTGEQSRLSINPTVIY